jgi:D-alanine-D-alanine ligase
VQAYKIIGCAGIVRFDFMLDLDNGALYFNELNPLPGSLAHYLWAKSSPNLLYTEMLDIAIEGALVRHENKRMLRTNEGFKALT